jgi:hypothetical protein
MSIYEINTSATTWLLRSYSNLTSNSDNRYDYINYRGANETDRDQLYVVNVLL